MIVDSIKRSQHQTKNITLRIKEDLLKQLDEKCRKQHVSKNQVIEELIKLFLDN